MKQLPRPFRTAGVVLALAWAAAGVSSAQRTLVDPPQPASVPGHLARAKQIAGNEPFASWVAAKGYWCMPPVEGRTSAFEYARSPDAVPPLQVFDNLYYVGKRFVGVYILKTNAGLVMWDALDNPTEARTILVPGMEHFHLNPADIKLIIITHGHFDHFGGAKYMQDTYHTPVAASAADWGLMAAYKSNGTDARPAPPHKDRVLTDGEKIKVGDATIRIVITPGHTPGTVSSILPVKDKGVTRYMAMWGGTAYPATMEALDAMGASMQKFKKAATAADVTGLLNDHPRFFNIRQRLAERDPNGPNPLVIGLPDVQKSLDVMSECLDSMKDWYTAMGRK
jgi:metallo-beta-lactamase class B